MGFVSNLLGLGGGGNGADFKAQGLNGPSGWSSDWATGIVNKGIVNQEGFLNALAAQNGIGNQSSVFGQQQNLANILSQQAQGNGPNPALAQLANTTGQNIQSQAALMAGQRGVGANPGLLANQIGQQGASIGQQAGGQAAALRAQQQIAAQQQLQQQQAMMGNLSTQQVGQQQAGTQGFTQSALSNQGNMFGLQGNINNSNAGVAQQNAKTQGSMLQGVAGNVGTAITGLLAGGGEVPGTTFEKWVGGRNMTGGGKVSGKAKISGDSYANDTVKAKLSPGEVVIPRSKVDDEEKTAKFLNAILGMNLRSGGKAA